MSTGEFAWMQLSGISGDSVHSAEHIADSLDFIKDISGDMNTCNTVYVGFGGSGAAYRTNYLLKRDLDPGSSTTTIWYSWTKAT